MFNSLFWKSINEQYEEICLIKSMNRHYIYGCILLENVGSNS